MDEFRKRLESLGALGFHCAELPAEPPPTPETTIRFLVARLVADRLLDANEAESAVKALLRREELGSTGIGLGVAIPHASCAGVTSVVGVCGLSHCDISWPSVDGLPVRVVCLILGPRDQRGLQLRTLEKICRALRGV